MTCRRAKCGQPWNRFSFKRSRHPLGVLQIGTEPQRIRWNMTNPHPDLRAHLQLDCGYCAAGTTVWVSDVTVNELKTKK